MPTDLPSSTPATAIICTPAMANESGMKQAAQAAGNERERAIVVTCAMDHHRLYSIAVENSAGRLQMLAMRAHDQWMIFQTVQRECALANAGRRRRHRQAQGIGE